MNIGSFKHVAEEVTERSGQVLIDCRSCTAPGCWDTGLQLRGQRDRVYLFASELGG